MKDYFIVNKKVSKNILSPSYRIAIEDFIKLVEDNEKLTWFEDTEHGRKKERYSPSIKKVTAYLNYSSKLDNSFTQIYAPISGYIRVTFENTVDKYSLIDLIEIAVSIDCKLWQYKPKQMIIDKDFIENYGKKKKKEE